MEGKNMAKKKKIHVGKIDAFAVMRSIRTMVKTPRGGAHKSVKDYNRQRSKMEVKKSWEET